MKPGAFVISGKWLERVKSLPETGVGYTVVNIKLTDDRCFRQALIDAGVLTRIRGMADIPFREEEIYDISASHEKWDWNEVP